MKIRISMAMYFLTLLVSAAAQTDWGGKVENITQYATMEDETFTQADKLSFWGKYAFSGNSLLYTEAGYLFRYENEEAIHAPELKAFYLNVKESGFMGTDYTLGRFRMKDSSRLLLNSIADGFSISYPSGQFSFSFSAGYTGLVFIDSSEIVMTPSDDYEKQDDQGFLAPPRIVQVLNLKFSGLTPGLTLLFSLAGQEDLRTEEFIEDYVPGTGKFHTQYALAGLEGLIRPDLFFSFSGVFQTGQYIVPETSDNYLVLAGLGKAVVEYYPAARYSPKASIELLYASGDSWENRGDWVGYSISDPGQLNRFSSISNATKGFVYTLQTGNVLYGDLGFSIKPLKNLQAAIHGTTFFRAVNGPVSDSSITEESGDSLYLGEEIDLIVNWRPFSDLGLSFTTGVFLPNSDIFEDDDMRFRAGTYLSFSF